MATAHILQLAHSILDNTSKVNEYFVSRNLPSPSFESSGPSENQVSADAPEIEAARLAVVDAALELRDLMLGPREYLMSFQHNELISMQATVRFGFAKAVPVDGEATYAQIAAATGINEANTRRLIRHAVTKRIFREPREGVVTRSSASKLLATDPVLADWAGASTDDLWQAASQTLNAMTKWPESQEPSQTGFALANGSSKTAFEILGDHPDHARRFGSAMKAFTEGKPYDLSHLSNNYPFASIGEGTVVDVGGSNGFVSVHLAEKFPKLKFVVQDFASVVEGADARVPVAVKDHIIFMPHDFLQEQPIKNADLDSRTKPGARVVVMDNVLPNPGTLPHMIESRLRSIDLTMTEMQNSKEREMDDWKSVFERADSRFEFLSGYKPEGSNLWTIEIKWQE